MPMSAAELLAFNSLASRVGVNTANININSADVQSIEPSNFAYNVYGSFVDEGCGIEKVSGELTVRITKGAADTNTAFPLGYYRVFTDLTEVAISANTSGSTRVDVIYLSKEGSLLVETGTPGAGEPATPSNGMKIYSLSIPTGTTTDLSGATLTDERIYTSNVTTALPSAGTYIGQTRTLSGVLYYWNGSSWVALGSAASVSGTTGTIAKFTGAGTVGDSVIQESSSKIGIGVAPSSTLHVQAANQTSNAGIVKIAGTGTDGGFLQLEDYGVAAWCIGVPDGTDAFQIRKNTAIGTLKFHVDNTGVGIGTASPGTNLDISSAQVGFSATSHQRIQDLNDASGNYAGTLYQMRTNNSGKGWFGFKQTGSYGVGDFVWLNDSTGDDNAVGTGDNTMVFTSGGNLGIGTTSPGTLLHVKDITWTTGNPQGCIASVTGKDLANNFGHFLIADGSTTSGAGRGGRLSFAVGSTFGVDMTPIADIHAEYTSGSGTDGSLHFGTRTAGGNIIDKMTILGAGNVGIGTASPQGKLHVSGGDLIFDTGKGMAFTGVAISASTPYMRYNTADLEILIQNNVTGGRLNFGTPGGNMYLDSSGNLGIGIATPGAVLEVSAPVSSSMFRISRDVAPTTQYMDIQAGADTVIFDAYGTSDAAYPTFTWKSTNNTSTATRMTIDANGYFYVAARIGIGKTPGYQLELNTDSAAKPTTTTWTATSDARTKINIVAADQDRCIEIIKGIPLVHHGWEEGLFADGTTNDTSQLGWLAQDVEQFFPNAVTENKIVYNSKDANGDPIKVIVDGKHLNPDQLLKVLWGAVQKLTAHVGL